MPSDRRFLFVVRHAKSSWKEAGLCDHERPLNKRGLRDAPVMARRLAEQSERPELIVSSSAVRALATARVFASEMKAANEKATASEKAAASDKLVIEDELYAASAETMLRVIRGMDDSITRVMIVGHNPGLTDFVNALSGCDIDNVPTCGVAVIRLRAARWQEVEFGSGELLKFDFPKNGM